MNLLEKTLAIIGLGYVGLPLAIEFGKTQPVIGFDINQKRISELKSGIDSGLELNTSDLSQAKHLIYSSDSKDLINASVFIVTVPTPINQTNQPDLGPLIRATELIASFLKKGAIVIYESTVYPGCTEEVCVPLLELNSGLKFNIDFFCAYSPERINPGDKINTLTKVKKITSGSTIEVADAVDVLYKSIIKAGTYKASSIKVAEAAKVIENTQRDLNIALVNELSVLFNRLDIDTVEVLEAAGTKWNFLPFRPGLVGGHCIGVDPYYLTHKAESVGYHPQIITSGRRMNDSMARYVSRKVIQLMVNNKIDISQSKISVMGITFKEDCPDIRNSKVVDLIKELQNWGIEVVVTDPYADPEEVMHEYGIKLSSIDDLYDADALIVAVAHKEYRELSLNKIRQIFKTKKPVFADLKSIYSKQQAIALGLTVFKL
jgi:UDP-N-acetyl-D-galactosamine dehydrogenase